MLTDLIGSLIDYLSANPHVAYGAVFLLALSESLPVIGAIVPGTAVILALSALVPSGVLVLWPMLIAATLGAIGGDGLSFWLGHRYQREILGVWPLGRHPELIERSEAFFKRHGDKSVFLARFTPGVRAFIPLLAGMLRMPVTRFYVVNILSALVWAPSHILPGVFVGAAFGVLGAAAKPLAILLILLGVTGWAVWHVVGWILRYGVPLLVTALERLRIWAATRDTRIKRGVDHLLDPARPQARVLVLLALILAGAAWAFFGLLEDVVNGDPLVLADNAIYRALQSLRSTPADSVMIFITELGDTEVVLAVTLAVFFWLAWKRAWVASAYWLVAIAGASALNTAIKVSLHRARPNELLYSGSSAFSFPSGHSTVNMVLYGFLAFLIARDSRPVWRLPIALGAATLIFLIAFSRLYLGAHWLSDVLGGLAFGSAWLALLGLSYMRRRINRIEPRGLLAVGCAALALAGGYNVYHGHAKDMDRYAVVTSAPTLAADDWWTRAWQRLPARRIDLTGEANEPMTVQWAGDPMDLEQALRRSGWRATAPWTPMNALTWLTAPDDPGSLPALPSVAAGHLPSLILARPGEAGANGASRLVLRLWAVDFALAGPPVEPLWVGSVVEERLEHPFSLVTLSSTRSDADAPRQTLAQDLDGVESVLRAREESEAGWDGQVLLARPGAAN
jgi:undecaprenyl-diphosphatase